MKSLQFFNGSDQIGSANVFWLDDGTYLANFQIKPEYQRQGYGKQFMELLIALYHVDKEIIPNSGRPTNTKKIAVNTKAPIILCHKTSERFPFILTVNIGLNSRNT